MNQVKFPDLEIVIVDFLKSRFPNIYVATKRPDPESNFSSFVVVNGGYGLTLDWVRREASIAVEVYHVDEILASEIALDLATQMHEIVGDPVKFVEIDLGPVRMAEESKFEKRAITFNFIVKGFNN